MSTRYARRGISSVAPAHLCKLLMFDNEELDNSEGDFGSLAIQTVNTQLANHEIRMKTVRYAVDSSGSRVPTLFDTVANKLSEFVSEDPEGDMKNMEGLPQNVLSRAAFNFDKIPYDLFCKARISDQNHGDVDEWVLRNEMWLREALPPGESHGDAPSKRLRSEKGESIVHPAVKAHWTRGLVQLSMHANMVFPGSALTDTCRTITRPTSLPGFKILDGRRPPVICIQPSIEMFAKKFEAMTGGLLKGLIWDHVFVAGGIVLGALLCTDNDEATNTPEQWKNSDVDLYIYGLGPTGANKKIEEIFNVFKANLPEDSPVLVVRNSRTITFFSKYPVRRIQIVLKLVDSPKDVLLNFDLDICAVGWDGVDVWMLPRAARALETGYTVFTMDLINGHYLGDRRATQEQRVFKYADKGYGIRILPSYLEGLQSVRNDPEKREAFGIVEAEQNAWGFPEKLWDLRGFQDIVEDARKWTARAIAHLRGANGVNGTLVVSHSWLQERTEKSEDPPGRSVLSNLNLFMRHVALWECEVAGDITIEKDTWAAQMYDDMSSDNFGISYNDAPDYSWDESFTIDGFISNLTKFNANEAQQLAVNLLGSPAMYAHIPTTESLFGCLTEGSKVQRITYASSVQDILHPQCDIYLPLWLTDEFIGFAESLISQSVHSSGIPDYTTEPFLRPLKEGISCERADKEDLRLVLWRITCITMWQQLNRAIDEVHEVLWSFHHANAKFIIVKEKRLMLLKSQLAKRMIRMTTQEEFGAFARWVARKPRQFSSYNDMFDLVDLDEEEGADPEEEQVVDSDEDDE